MIFKTKVKKERRSMSNWFQIPVANMERAISFYELVFDIKLVREQIGNLDMAFFPSEEKGIGGALVLEKNYKPAESGTIIHFSTTSPDMEEEIFRVETSRGEIISHKTLINEDLGYMACVYDTEGNKIALHSRF